jgi:hypothetical protein
MALADAPPTRKARVFATNVIVRPSTATGPTVVSLRCSMP